MKKISVVLGVVSMIVLMLTSGCAKNDTIISGTISYIADLDGVEYLADGATVYLMVQGSTTEYALTTTTDADGKYSFYPVDDGSYYVEAEYSYGLSNYSGKSEDFEAKGKDDYTLDITMN